VPCDTGEVLDPGLLLRTAEGSGIRVGAFYGSVLVIHCLRYYG
jgi:hypothetical protein